MVNARGFVWLDENEAEHPDRLWGVADEPRPLAVQIWDNDPETMAKVGRRLAHEYKVSVVDINFGCPVRQVTEKAHSGSYLLREPARMSAIISRLVEVFARRRSPQKSGWDAAAPKSIATRSHEWSKKPVPPR